MNIFDIYLNKIKELILDLNKNGAVKIPDNLNSINVDIPPEKFDSDISTNVAMILSKINNSSPLEFAKKIEKDLKKIDPNIEKIEIVKPGFINIKFNSFFWSNFLKEILNNHKSFGIKLGQDKKNFLVEFVSANPTGPLHVGHCRGAIIGDVISNFHQFHNNIYYFFFIRSFFVFLQRRNCLDCVRILCLLKDIYCLSQE